MNSRKKTSPETIAAILKAHLQENIPVGQLAEKYGVKPSNIYRWQNQLFTNASGIFERKNDRRTGPQAADRNERRIADLEAKLATKNEVLGEVMEEFVKIKKLSGEI